MKFRWFIPGIILGLSACNWGVGVRVEHPPYPAPPADSIIELPNGLAVPGGWARVFLQRGQIVTYSELDRYYPSCNFELRTLSETSQEIMPGSYRVVRVQRQYEEVVSRPGASLHHVGFWRGTSGFSNSNAMIMYLVHLYLEAEGQPNIYRLSCRGALAMPHEAEWPTISEMREALGEHASLKLAERTEAI